ncbi:Gfo/Idh/MocA family protein [Nocardia miyunensis]|uniref:Gfo/Idh/MocA family protein n=1 Tax=Nocardia miyunensis TaxID=282684 RepID=UPI0008334097|nr:Gfo/Idh/MocA family oxidoreductase [Nocardia miyunensis]
MNSPLRIALIGTGMIAAVHLRAARDAGAAVVGVLASRPDKSRQVAETWCVPTGYRDLDALVHDRPDVVHVCTPNSTHVRYAQALVDAGINVIVEKPIATTVADAEHLAASVETAGVVASVPYVYRYHPLIREIRARRAAGEFGDVALVHGSYLQDWLCSPDASTWRVDPRHGGGSRAFGDIGTHWCDLAEFVSGEVFTEVSAATTITYPTRPARSVASFAGPAAADERVEVSTEDTAVALFRTARGITANTVISQVSAGRKNRLWLEIDGTRGSAVFDQENPETAWLGTEHGTLTLHRGEGTVAPEQARLNRTPPGHAQGWTDAFAAFVADTYAAVRGEHPEGLPTIRDGLRSVHLIDAVLRSASTGAWARIDA